MKRLIAHDWTAMSAFCITITRISCFIICFTEFPHGQTCYIWIVERKNNKSEELLFSIFCTVCVTNVSICKWHQTLFINFFYNTSNFVASCKIIQYKDWETRIFLYYSFLLLSVELNNDSYRQLLAIIAKWKKKYYSILNDPLQFIKYMYQKSLLGFFYV